MAGQYLDDFLNLMTLPGETEMNPLTSEATLFL